MIKFKSYLIFKSKLHVWNLHCKKTDFISFIRRSEVSFFVGNPVVAQQTTKSERQVIFYSSFSDVGLELEYNGLGLHNVQPGRKQDEYPGLDQRNELSVQCILSKPDRV